MGNIITAPVSVSTGEGLVDIVADPVRPRLYIANSGLNRVEVFGTASNQFLTPINTGTEEQTNRILVNPEPPADAVLHLKFR